MSRSRILILTFSPIAHDARVLKQIALLAPTYDVTTCGFGPAPAGVSDHVRIPDGVRHDDLHGRLITLRWYSRAYWSLSAVRWGRARLPRRAWDIVLANDIETVPLALALDPRNGVHADLHEFAPLQREDDPLWRRRISPYVSWLCARSLPRVRSITTVAEGIARRYERDFSVAVDVVINAAPHWELPRRPTSTTVRLVHSGVARRDRRLEVMIDAVARSSSCTLDLYLTRNDPAYVDELSALAASTGGRVRVLDPVAYSELIPTLNGYDVGIMVLPPTNFNKEWSLPNKLFDYVQARLGIIVGPSPEMRRYVERYDLGAVTRSFDADSIIQTLARLDTATVDAWKAASEREAAPLSAEQQMGAWESAIAALAAR